MANIHSRLSRLEEAIAREYEESPSGVPAEWCKFGDDGVIVGPPPGVHVTQGHRDTLSILKAMDSTIGVCRGAG